MDTPFIRNALGVGVPLCLEAKVSLELARSRERDQLIGRSEFTKTLSPLESVLTKTEGGGIALPDGLTLRKTGTNAVFSANDHQRIYFLVNDPPGRRIPPEHPVDESHRPVIDGRPSSRKRLASWSTTTPFSTM